MLRNPEYISFVYKESKRSVILVFELHVTRIIKVKKKPPQTNNSNNNNNQQMEAGRGIVLNNGSNIEASQSQRPQLGDY